MVGRWRSALLSLVLLFGVAACTQTAQMAKMAPSDVGGGKTATPGETFPSFPDIPVAESSRMNVDKTVVLGVGDWFGQLSISTRYNAHQMFDFYRDQLPKYGWREITAVRAPTSVLTYDHGNRVLAIQIRGETFGGAEVTVSVAPRGDDPANPGAAPPPTPAPLASPRAPARKIN